MLRSSWEEELRAGQQAEGEAGSVEDELAIVHLLRHAAAPEVLAEAAAARLWQDIDEGIEAQRPAPWWKVGWVRWVGTAAVSAAALTLVIVAWPDDTTPQSTDLGEVASAESTASLLQAQFEMLAPKARAEVDAQVDDGRAAMRSELLAQAAQTGRTMGGAP